LVVIGPDDQPIGLLQALFKCANRCQARRRVATGALQSETRSNCVGIDSIPA
jgi:hypothetical protein